MLRAKSAVSRVRPALVPPCLPRGSVAFAAALATSLRAPPHRLTPLPAHCPVVHRSPSPIPLHYHASLYFFWWTTCMPTNDKSLAKRMRVGRMHRKQESSVVWNRVLCALCALWSRKRLDSNKARLRCVFWCPRCACVCAGCCPSLSRSRSLSSIGVQ